MTREEFRQEVGEAVRAEFDRKFPVSKRGKTFRGKPSIGADGEKELVVVEEKSKPISRVLWLVVGGVGAALGFYLFKRFGPQQPQPVVVVQGEGTPKALTEGSGGAD